jgi:hypothetical protein
MVYTTKSAVDIHAVKAMVEEALGDIMRAEIEVDPDDGRLASITAEIDTGNLTRMGISHEDIMELVKKHYIVGYLNSKAVADDDPQH